MKTQKELAAFALAQAKYEVLMDKAAKWQDSLRIAKELRDTLCPHTEIEAKESYFPGGYYDLSYTDHWNQCKCCGAKSEVYRDSRGGSFS